ncbi:MAG: DUF4058 family protein [Anaerolineaceae bacterium]|nr:DUF4058 family protein [Anaerolineaceae bacterium]
MSTYRETYKQGPFPHRIDPWGEAPRYFQQIHSGIINDILNQIQDTIFDMGYLAGKETSLLITDQGKPDVFVRSRQTTDITKSNWNYSQAASTVMAEPGLELSGDVFPEPDAIHITHRSTGELVTIVEIISPRNKDRSGDMWDYIERRNRLIYGKGVNVVELDLTRSVKRLTQDILAETYAYHIAIYLFDEKPRFIGMDYGEALKRFALPLRHEVVGVDTQLAYDNAYQQAYIANHIEIENHYAESELPFPSLLTDAQIREAKESVTIWREELKRLEASSS